MADQAAGTVTTETGTSTTQTADTTTTSAAATTTAATAPVQSSSGAGTTTEQASTATTGNASAAATTTTTEPAKPAATAFPDDWRARMSGGDEKTLKMLERLQSPEALAKKLREQDVLISSGQIKKPLPANATPEQIAAYRAENGIPESADKYFENLPDGLVIGKDDLPIFQDFANTLLAKNLPPSAAHAAIEWYNSWQEKNQAVIFEADKQNAIKTEDALRQEWGADYRANVNLRSAFLDSAPPLVKDAFLKARLPDGSLLGEHADMSRWLVSMAREINPVASIPPSSGIGAGKSVGDRIGEINKMMGDKNSAYWKGERGPDNKTALEREYLQLLEVQQSNKKRGS